MLLNLGMGPGAAGNEFVSDGEVGAAAKLAFDVGGGVGAADEDGAACVDVGSGGG